MLRVMLDGPNIGQDERGVTRLGVIIMKWQAEVGINHEAAVRKINSDQFYFILTPR